MSNGGTFFTSGEIYGIKETYHIRRTSYLVGKKNIFIDDKSDCINFLSKVNYYRISGYLLPFIRKAEEKCFIDLSFNRIINIYSFDAELRNLLSYAIEKVEVYIRTQLTYHHAHTYGSEGYMLESSFNPKHNHSSFIKHVQSCIAENANTLVVKHHKKHYEGHFPLWSIMDFFSMGMLSYFYRGMKNPDKAEIAERLYGVNYQTLDSWLRCLTDLRNRCAHYSRLYYWIFPALPKMPSGEKYSPTRRLFAQLYMLKLMYPPTEDWNQDVLKPLIKLVKKYKPYISLKHLDFPYRWKFMLTK